MRPIDKRSSTASQQRAEEVDSFQRTGELYRPDPITLIIAALQLMGGWAAQHTHTHTGTGSAVVLLTVRAHRRNTATSRTIFSSSHADV